jgi:hypothetical protein
LDEDKETSDKHGKNMYAKIESRKDEKNFEQLEQMNGIRDFLNFVITQNGVLLNSVYGVLQENN